MEPRDLAGLKRKYTITEDPAKKNELANHLRMQGIDPDEVDAPPGVERSSDVKVTAEDAKPSVKVAPQQEDVPAPAGRARNGRAAKPKE